MKKNRFIKLRMIWNIIRGRSVMYKMKMVKDYITPITNNGCIVNCDFTEMDTSGLYRTAKLPKA